MVTKTNTRPTASAWHSAKGLLPCARDAEKGPHGALIPDDQHNSDHIAVVYDKGENPPEITIETVAGSVYKVLADGVAIAVIASANAPAPQVNDVLLVERST